MLRALLIPTLLAAMLAPALPAFSQSEPAKSAPPVSAPAETAADPAGKPPTARRIACLGVAAPFEFLVYGVEHDLAEQQVVDAVAAVDVGNRPLTRSFPMGWHDAAGQKNHITSVT